MPESAPRRRLFVAVTLPDPVRAHLAATVDELRQVEIRAVSAEVVGSASLRWGDPSSWHLTLVFCGAVTPEQAARFVARLARATARHRPFRLGLAGGGRFGNRVLWVGVAGDRAALVAVAGSAAAAARRSGISVEDRQYRPHLTIARGRPGADLAPTAAALDRYSGPTWRAYELVLIESILGAGPGGTARHVPVQAFPLG